ncbi:MAG: hypothetical protein ACRELB_14760 [Polyangiaceae bacterium]
MTHATTDCTEPTAYELAVRIAAKMTGPARWTARRRETMDDQGKRFAELVRLDDGAELGVTAGGYHNEGRATFRAHWPKYADGQQYSPRTYLQITCSAGRDPQALARDIERRLLSEYDPAYRKALDEVRASDAAAGIAWHAAERIAEAVGAELPGAHPNNGGAVRLHGAPADVYEIKVHPPYGDRPVRVSFEVNDVDEKTALEVLALIARNHGG